MRQGTQLCACLWILLLVAALPGAAYAESGGEETDLAKQLSNPISSLVSVPFQYNYDSGYGSADGSKSVLNIQPVIPFSVDKDWNIVSRTIFPIVWQDDIAGRSGAQSGLGDTVQSLFLSPKKTGESGIIWGVGPVFLLPAGTDALLSARKWGAGPTGVALKQAGPWTYGVLANHIWSFAGDSSRSSVNATFIQPFVTYTTPDAWSFALNTESTYDWEGGSWAVPVNVTVSKVTHIYSQPISLGAGARYWAETPDGGADGFGVRLVVTFLFPR